jgi:hypothetical protein
MQCIVQSESDSAENKIETPILDYSHYFQQFHGTCLLSLDFFPNYHLLQKDTVMDVEFLKKKKDT